MANICGVCRKDTADLISLKCREESQRILYKLQNFIDPNVSNNMQIWFWWTLFRNWCRHPIDSRSEVNKRNKHFRLWTKIPMWSPIFVYRVWMDWPKRSNSNANVTNWMQNKTNTSPKKTATQRNKLFQRIVINITQEALEP